MAEITFTVLDSLRSVNAYPIPLRTISSAAALRGLDVTEEATPEVLSGAAFRLATADLLWWLAFAPDVSQGGQNYSFTDEQRLQFRCRARRIWDELEDTANGGAGSVYGYKGSRL